MFTTPEKNAVQPPGTSPIASVNVKRMSELVATYDWSSTELGPLDGWPASLKATVALVLDSKVPMVVWWGDESLQIYNDAYAPRVDSRTGVVALGQPAVNSWAHGWESVRPLVRIVLDSGQSEIYPNFSYSIARDGWFEDTFWTYSLTPIRDDAGATRGVLLLSEDTTECTLTLRRQRTLDFLRQSLSSASKAEELELAVKRAVEFNPEDLYGVQLSASHQINPFVATSAHQQQVTARDVGVNVDLALVFKLSPKVAFNLSYRLFLEQFTLLVAREFYRVNNEALRLLVEAERDRLLLDAPVGAAVMMGEDLVYQLVNSMYAMVSGRTADAMVGKPFVEVFPELNGSPVHEQFKAVYRGVNLTSLSRRWSRFIVTGAPLMTDTSLITCHHCV